MNTNTDPVRALLTKWRSESTSDDQSSDYECGEHDARSECADELESALSQQPAAPSGEAVAWAAMSANGSRVVSISLDRDEYVGHVVPLYTAPQQPAAVDEAAAQRLADAAKGDLGWSHLNPQARAEKARRYLAIAANHQEVPRD